MPSNIIAILLQIASLFLEKLSIQYHPKPENFYESPKIKWMNIEQNIIKAGS